MTEVRRVAWPAYEKPEWSDPMQFQQGIAGRWNSFSVAFAPFQQFVGEITGYPVPVFQRIDQAGSNSHSMSEYWETLTHSARLRTRSQYYGPGGCAGGGRGGSAVSVARRNLPDPGPASQTSGFRMIRTCEIWSTSITAMPWCHDNSASVSTQSR
jgi:hypothetical protein